MYSAHTGVTIDQSWAADVAVLGRTPAYQSFYYSKDAVFPDATLNGASPATPTVMITWFGWPDSEVNAGIHDTQISSEANRLKNLNRAVLLKWDIEFNITSFGYEPTGAAQYGPSFVQAWQRVRGIFTSAGATNVSFVWCANCNSPFDPQSWRPYYPGDAYVDWIGVDGYNWGNSGLPKPPTSWQTAYQVFHQFVTDWQGNFGGLSAGGKPLLIGETGCFDGGGSKSWWYSDLSGYVHSQGFAAVTLLNSNQQSSQINWRWDSDSAATQAAIELGADPWFGGSSTTGLGYPAAIAALSPYAYWTLGELSGSFADSSGNGFTATSGGSTGTTTRGCVLKWPGAGYGCSFYSFGHIDLSAVGTFGSAMSSGFTASFLYKDGSTGTAGTIIGQLNSGTATGLMISVNTDHTLAAKPGRTIFWLRNEAGAVHYVETTASIYDGQWHHVVWVARPGSTDALYIDGQAVTPSAAASPAAGTTSNFHFDPFLGSRNNRGATDQPVIGVAAHLALWKTVLNASQVAGLWSALTT